VTILTEDHGLPVQRACQIARCSRTAFYEAGDPNQNAYLERFNRSFREEVLDAWVFTTLAEVRAVSDEWRHGYSTERSHESRGNVPP
jgi:putative transposase